MRLYMEVQLSYLVSDHGNPINHPIYAIEQDMRSCILHVKDNIIDNIPVVHKEKVEKDKIQNDGKQIWKLYFDGSSSREGLGVGIVLISPSDETINLSYKLEFETTTNIAEYEALILGLRAAKYLKIQAINVFGHSELTI